MSEVYPSGWVYFCHFFRCTKIYILIDPPIKRLAQRYMYLGTDAIADRDLGFAVARRTTRSNSVGRTETTQSGPAASQNAQSVPPKRAASPDFRKRDDGRIGEYGGHKRMRALSPVRGAERDRDGRWDVPTRRRFSPAPPPSSRSGRELQRSHDREDDKPRPALPAILSWFIGELPSPASFDGEFIPTYRS